jgi:hypothetical protein
MRREELAAWMSRPVQRLKFYDRVSSRPHFSTCCGSSRLVTAKPNLSASFTRLKQIRFCADTSAGASTASTDRQPIGFRLGDVASLPGFNSRTVSKKGSEPRSSYRCERYISEAYGGYQFDVMHGINVDAGIFMSYVGLHGCKC